jgi:chromosome segregation ATPase
MTNSQTIEKLNEGLIQLIDAYEILQGKNEKLEDEIKDLNAKNTDLEYKLSDFNNNNEEQDTKMDGMLNKIQNLLQVNTSELTNSNDKVAESENPKESEDHDESSEESILNVNNDSEADDAESTSKIDLGRMESLLNGLNNRQ